MTECVICKAVFPRLDVTRCRWNGRITQGRSRVGPKAWSPRGGQGIASNLARSPIFESWCDVLTNGNRCWDRVRLSAVVRRRLMVCSDEREKTDLRQCERSVCDFSTPRRLTSSCLRRQLRVDRNHQQQTRSAPVNADDCSISIYLGLCTYHMFGCVLTISNRDCHDDDDVSPYITVLLH